LRYHMMWF